MLPRNRARVLAIGILFAGLGLSAAAIAQDKETPADETGALPAKLTVGDPAPPLKVEKFVKGDPVKAFKPGHTYVLDFWSTWCGPCRASMPHLTELQKKFDGKITVIGVNIWEAPKYSDETLTKVQDFVKQNSEKMGYTVAYDGAAKKADKAYMEAAGADGIPTAFVVTPDGKIAYIGHPEDPAFAETLQQIVDGKFDLQKAVAAYKKAQAEQAAWEKARGHYIETMMAAQDLLEAGKVDEALAKVDEAAKLMPAADQASADVMKFRMLMAAQEYDRAYAIGARLIAGPFNDDAMVLNAIAWSIVDPEIDIDKPDVALAFKAAERAVELTDSMEPAVIDTLARCYWLKGDKAKAVELQKQAIGLVEDPAMKTELQKTLDEYQQKETR